VLVAMLVAVPSPRSLLRTEGQNTLAAPLQRGVVNVLDHHGRIRAYKVPVEPS
jgi:hypothetical protein